MENKEYIGIRMYKETNNNILIVPVIGGCISTDYWYITFNNDNYEEIGECIFKVVEYINAPTTVPKTSMDLEGNEPWRKATKYKTFKSFREHTQSADIRNSMSDFNKISVYSEYKDHYMSGGPTFKAIALTLDATTAEEIGRAVIDVFTAVEEYYKENPYLQVKKRKAIEFDTVGGRKVKFLEVSQDFTDIEDANSMEVYQAYEFTDAPDNIIAFVMENGYEKYDEVHIRKRCEEMYGTIKKMTYKEKNDELKTIEFTVKTEDKLIISHIYNLGENEDEHDYLEVYLDMDTENTHKYSIAKLKREFERMVKTIEITLGDEVDKEEIKP